MCRDQGHVRIAIFVRLLQPSETFTTGVALDSSGNLYIAEFGSYRIRKVSGGMITPLAGWTFWLGRPWQIAVDSTGQNIYVTELDNNTIRRLQAAPP